MLGDVLSFTIEGAGVRAGDQPEAPSRGQHEAELPMIFRRTCWPLPQTWLGSYRLPPAGARGRGGTHPPPPTVSLIDVGGSDRAAHPGLRSGEPRLGLMLGLVTVAAPAGAADPDPGRHGPSAPGAAADAHLGAAAPCSRRCCALGAGVRAVPWQALRRHGGGRALLPGLQWWWEGAVAPLGHLGCTPCLGPCQTLLDGHGAAPTAGGHP